MIAYNHTSLNNLLINEEATFALHHDCISKEEADGIWKKYPVNLYSPNSFIRLGLFLLTTLIVFMLLGFIALTMLSASETKFGVLILVFSLGTYAALEFVVHDRNHFHSGIDDAMIWLSMGFMVTAVNLLVPDLSFFGQSALIFVLATYFSLRFGDVLMSGLSFIAFLGVVFYGIIPAGNIAKSIMPFLLMAISFFVYWVVRGNKNNYRLRHYKDGCTLVEILALIVLYAASNYFVVREVSNSMFDLNLKPGESIPAGWFFWILTILLPLIYIYKGIQKRDVILLRTGLVLIAAIVFTIRYYHHVAPLEIVMSIGGIIMIGIAYFVTKYLTPPKYGITHAEPNDPQLAGLLQVESLVITQTFHQTTAPGSDDHFDFGGGSGGGAGASGNF